MCLAVVDPGDPWQQQGDVTLVWIRGWREEGGAGPVLCMAQVGGEAVQGFCAVPGIGQGAGGGLYAVHRAWLWCQC
jgi:hypothetical protein